MRGWSFRAAQLARAAAVGTAFATATGTAFAAAQDGPPRIACENREIGVVPYTVCVIPGAAVPRLNIADAPEAAAHGWTFARLDRQLRAENHRLALAVNAGIFGLDGRPLGLLIRDRRAVVPLNRGDGRRAPGTSQDTAGDVCDRSNFYCPPNGVFFVDNGQAAILPTAEFARIAAGLTDIRLATQSGPLLLDSGRLARAFPPTWRRLTARNAVCVRPDGAVLLVLALRETLGGLAIALRDTLGCRDALYLDGSVSDLFAGDGPVPDDDAYGAILYVATALARDSASDIGSVRSVRDPRRPRPYGTITLRAGAVLGAGGELEAEAPTSHGLLGTAVAPVAAGSGRRSGAGLVFAADWRALMPLTARLSLRAGARVGPVIRSATWSLRLAAGPTIAADYRLRRRSAVTVAGTWLAFPAGGGSPVAALSIAASKTLATPAWLKRLAR